MLSSYEDELADDYPEAKWEELDEALKAYDTKKPKKVSYPKGSLEEAKEQAIKELKGGV